MNMTISAAPHRTGLKHRAALAVRRDWQLWVLLLPALAFFIVFCYFPMYGVQIAFRDYKAAFGITGSKWVGLKYFEKFFSSYYCGRMFLNTFLLNAFGLLFGFPIPILLAIMLNQLNRKRFKGFAQTAIYVPHFISTVVLAGMIYLFFSPTNGIINHLITAAGGKSIYFIMEASWFRPLFIGSEIWQNAGWNTILYIATLTSIDPQLYEAATIDGATRWEKIKHIDIPHLVPIAVMMLILNCGSVMDFYNIFSLTSCQSINDLDDLLRRLCDYLLSGNSSEEAVSAVEEDEISQVVHYMEEHFSNPEISMTALADSFDLSTTRFSLSFKEKMGMTPLDYLTLLRVEKAKELLASTNLTIQDISLQVGYYDSGSFIRRFKQVTGETPLQYRRSHGSDAV